MDAMLREMYGPDSVACPDLKTAEVYRSGLMSVMVVAALPLVASIVFLCWCQSLQMALISILGGVCTAAFVGIILARGFLIWGLHKSGKIAMQNYDRLQPNIIVAVGFGAVIARRLPRAKPALLLIQPAVIQYERMSGENRGRGRYRRRHRRWDQYPYLMVVDERGSSYINDQFRLMRRADPVRSRLDLFEPNTISRAGPTQAELKGLIDLVYENGKQGAAELALLWPDVAVPLQMF